MFGVNMAFDDYTQTYEHRLESLGEDERVVKDIVTVQFREVCVLISLLDRMI